MPFYFVRNKVDIAVRGNEVDFGKPENETMDELRSGIQDQLRHANLPQGITPWLISVHEPAKYEFSVLFNHVITTLRQAQKK